MILTAIMQEVNSLDNSVVVHELEFAIKHDYREDGKSHTNPGTKKCKTCKKVVNFDHKCYIQPFSPEERKNVRFIFHDFETDQSSGEYVPYFCVAQNVCEKCIHIPIRKYCDNCHEAASECIFE